MHQLTDAFCDTTMRAEDADHAGLAGCRGTSR